ncbi:MAG: DUF805 domain-containing protein [Sphingobacteriaceae bacterium]|nr:DUF805 domain-containing protein [Cytophagaceae bacterium]
MNASTQSPAGSSILTNYTTVLKKFADFDGRARRSEYWYFFLVNVLVSISFNVIGMTLGGSTFIGLLSMLFTLAVLVPSVAVAVRRMHDVGKSGWYALIPVYNLVLACTEGMAGGNEYGADPKK